MRLTTKGRFAVTAMIDLALREHSGPVALAAISAHRFFYGVSTVSLILLWRFDAVMQPETRDAALRTLRFWRMRRTAVPCWSGLPIPSRRCVRRKCSTTGFARAAAMPFWCHGRSVPRTSTT